MSFKSFKTAWDILGGTTALNSWVIDYMIPGSECKFNFIKKLYLLARLTVVILLQYIQTPNHCYVPETNIMVYGITSQLKKMLVCSDIKKSYVFKKMILAAYHSILNMQNLFRCDLYW